MPPTSQAAEPAGALPSRPRPIRAIAKNGMKSVSSIARMFGLSLTSCTRGTVGGKMLLTLSPSICRAKER